MTVGMPPKPSQTFIMTKDIALKHSIGAKPSIHTALVPEALMTIKCLIVPQIRELFCTE